MRVLVIDIGGSHVKLHASEGARQARFDSGQGLTPEAMVNQVHIHARHWDYDVVSMGYPGGVDANGPTKEPGNLADGWVGFDFAAAFGVPVRIVNDAVLQALGGYDGGRMLFLGLGTGVGSALIAEHVIVPLELGCLPYGDSDGTIADRIGSDGLERIGAAAWQEAVTSTVAILREAMSAEYVLLGGGNARRVDPLPGQTRQGGNDDAFTGGVRLWEEFVEPHDRPPAAVWRVVR
jgi:polyphosphate glucokinase